MEHYDYVKNAVSFDVIQGDEIPITMPMTQELGLVYRPLEAEQLL